MASRTTTMALLALLAAGAAGAQGIEAGAVLAADDFERFEQRTAAIGTLPQGGQAWRKLVAAADGSERDELVRGEKGQIWIGYSSGTVNAPAVFVEGLRIADGVIELTVGPSTMGERPHSAVISYRAAEGEAVRAHAPGAYHVWLVQDWAGSRDLELRYGDRLLAAADLADTHDPTASYRVTVAFSGDRHVVTVDGRTLIDFWEWEPGRAGAGLVGFGAWYSQGYFDDFAVREAGPPGEPVYDTSTGRIPPLLYQRRPFLPLGTYDLPGAEDIEEFLQSGGNCVIVPTFDEKLPTDERLAQVRAAAQWGAQYGVAMVYHPRIDFYSYEGEQAIPTRPEEIPSKIALINEMLAVTADHPNTLGYWTFDEPENALYKAYGQWEQRKDVGLAQWITEGMRWTYEAFKTGDPDAYIMPTIAWWTTYEGLAPLYDVNVPNTYQGGEEIYQVVYDCRCAADAIRATDAHSFIFMPAIYDTPGWYLHSRPEMRYSFIAPFTQGAMGILGWRLGRASMEYRRAVIYPVMREVNRLVPWLLGEWHDSLVTSDHDTATADYLRELPVRVRLVPGEEDGETVRVEEDAVPDCSHCLRRAADGTWLLIAVSNRREPMTVTFTLDITNLPEKALDLIDWREANLANGQITEQFEPFGVRAWRIVPD